MPVAAGSRLGPYEVVSPLGAGGMGEVWRARDTKLNREVALKILPEAFALDADRLARFKREAQVLASLNHPHIGAIYGFEESSGIHALVLELVDGPTLADRIEQGPIPLDDALPIAKQIVEALEAAHEQGIIHRDLKPANIKLRPDETVKVLDFGLAKLMAGDEGGGSKSAVGLTHSPTLSIQATYAGIILGTAAYMSPEQARGKPVDRRTDVWAFGCVLFEMLTGRKAFEASGDTVSDAVATVLLKEPDWAALPNDTPPHIESLLRRCLRKDVQKRVPHIGVARLEIDEPAHTHEAREVPTPIAPRPLWRRAIPVAVAVLLTAIVTGGVAWWRLKPDYAPPIVTRFALPLAEGQQFTNVGRLVVGISPDGTQMVYVANNRIYLRSMADIEARPIPGTEGPSGGVTNPVFSPDGRSIAFFSVADGSLKKIAITGGAPVTLCTATNPFGMTWDTSGILFGQNQGRGIMRVSPNGGKPETLIGLKSDEVAHGPQLLPDNDTVLFTIAKGNGPERWDKAQVVAQSLRSGHRTTLVEAGSDGRYLPSGHVVYALSGVLYAIPFDVKRLRVVGGQTPVLEGVMRAGATGSAHFSASTLGSLVFVPGPAATSSETRTVALVDRKGVLEPLKLTPAAYEGPRVSPDGKWIAVGVEDETEANIWIYDLAGTTSRRRLTFGGKNRYPLWSPDSRRVAYQSDREGDLGIFSQLADGTGPIERLTKAERETAHVPETWKGDLLLFSVTKGVGAALWSLSVRDKKSSPFGGVQGDAVWPASALSPDGRWVAYMSRDGGTLGIYVQPVPPTGTKYLIMTNAIHPLWSPDGTELFAAPRGQFGVVKVTTQPTFAFSSPAPIPRTFQDGGPVNIRGFDMMPDGQHFLVVSSSSVQATTATPQIQVVLNWFEELKRLAPPK